MTLYDYIENILENKCLANTKNITSIKALHEHLKDEKLKEINLIKIDRLDNLDFLNRLFRVKLQENNPYVESYLKWLGNLPYSDKQQYLLENLDIIFLDNVKTVISLCHDILNESCQKDLLLEELRDTIPPTSSFHGLAEQLYLYIVYNSGKLVDYPLDRLFQCL